MMTSSLRNPLEDQTQENTSMFASTHTQQHACTCTHMHTHTHTHMHTHTHTHTHTYTHTAPLTMGTSINNPPPLLIPIPLRFLSKETTAQSQVKRRTTPAQTQMMRGLCLFTHHTRHCAFVDGCSFVCDCC